MSIPLQNARLCLDCDTVFDEAQCPGCNSQSYFPLSRWVRPAMESDAVVPKKSHTAKKASAILLGSGAAFAMWKLLKKPDDKAPKK
jgi:RNA polymerase subunit RPABC4/transcription elongation factor Spt4